MTTTTTWFDQLEAEVRRINADVLLADAPAGHRIDTVGGSCCSLADATAALGAVNDAEFLGAPAGTLLYAWFGYEAEGPPRRSFLYRPSRRFNDLLSLAGVPVEVVDANGATAYPKRSFEELP